MPCYQINELSLDFKHANKGVLYAAANKIGLEWLGPNALRIRENGRMIYLQDGNKAQCDARDVEIVNKLRIGYAHEVVNQTAQKLGWQKVAQTATKLTLKKG